MGEASGTSKGMLHRVLGPGYWALGPRYWVFLPTADCIHRSFSEGGLLTADCGLQTELRLAYWDGGGQSKGLSYHRGHREHRDNHPPLYLHMPFGILGKV